MNYSDAGSGVVHYIIVEW